MDIPYYIHNLNPVILPLWGPIAIRWYGLAYLAGFVAAIQLLKYLSRKEFFQVDRYEIQNFIVWIAVFGVFLGGRLGYMLFYAFDEFSSNPLYFFHFWEGGMASHGGMLATILCMIAYGKKNRISFWNLADNLACVAPVGILFGRIANFINGELWGRITDVPWAVIFPTEANLNHSLANNKTYILRLVEQGMLHPRHPSQLYEAFGEGLLLFGILWWLRHKRISRQPGFLSVCFLLIYAAARIIVEFAREPDSTIYFDWMTKGQLLSFWMIALALILWFTLKLKIKYKDNL